jgi:hypothetical protein
MAKRSNEENGAQVVDLAAERADDTSRADQLIAIITQARAELFSRQESSSAPARSIIRRCWQALHEDDSRTTEGRLEVLRRAMASSRQLMAEDLTASPRAMARVDDPRVRTFAVVAFLRGHLSDLVVENNDQDDPDSEGIPPQSRRKVTRLEVLARAAVDRWPAEPGARAKDGAWDAMANLAHAIGITSKDGGVATGASLRAMWKKTPEPKTWRSPRDYGVVTAYEKPKRSGYGGALMRKPR